MDKKARLQALLPLFLEKRPTEACDVEDLSALVRVYVALYRLTVVCGDAEAFGRRSDYARLSDALFPVLLRRAGSESDFERRARLVSAAFFLSGETSFSYDAARADACREAALGLLHDYSTQERADDLAHACVCRCIADLCYPDDAAGAEWLPRLSDRIDLWARTLDGHGGWAGVSGLLALERVEVMNRYSYMFLDDRFDDAIRRAYGHSAARMSAVLTDVHAADGPRAAETLSRSMPPIAAFAVWYDAAMQGNAYPVDSLSAGRIARCLDALSASSSLLAPTRLQALSCVVAALCESLVNDLQREMMKN